MIKTQNELYETEKLAVTKYNMEILFEYELILNIIFAINILTIFKFEIEWCNENRSYVGQVDISILIE